MCSTTCGEAVGACVTCGTQCYLDGSLAVLCPNYNCPVNVYDRIQRRREEHLALVQDDY